MFRTLNELGSYAQITDGVIFHNTLASSDYGFLHHGTFEPRPNYYAVLLWNRLMGTVVYDCGNPDMENAHIYCHSRRDGKQGFAYLVINNSLEDSLIVEIPKETDCYSLSSDGMRSSVMKLNGVELTLSNTSKLLNMRPKKQKGGKLELAPGSCIFFVLP